VLAGATRPLLATSGLALLAKGRKASEEDAPVPHPILILTPAEATKHFTWFARFAAMEVPSSSNRIRKLRRWEPKERGLFADIDHPRYFDA
jgi:hypothetical protein